ncbi:response regulator [Roseobacter litoralis]|uniref:Response regulator n=1 Tax=Roseobacter litoralis (strain ATCC 49566 / DSM 6996 / JCM 21268 / NBRC 15278 / OCh 149) TaxID=391595 RepID=F7ZIN1_ROSLO|nr:response regulator [Roseobacter litoralis]AEI93750.1 putative response regulator [Roseobacter litoralis Och 149]
MKRAKKILLIEDDDFTRFMMRQIIKTLNVDVDVAHDGQDGVLKLSQNPCAYGVILMDIHMPRLDGTESTRRIRTMSDDPPRNVPIIAVTTDERYHNSELIADLGMNGFISKPVTAGELIGLVDRYCVGSLE